MNDLDNRDPVVRFESDLVPEARILQNIRAMESRVVTSTKALIKAGSFLQDVELLRELESNLEWFLTWRLKLSDVPTVMWCDGVIDLALHQKERLTFQIKARAYIGPETDTIYPALRVIAGTIVLDETTDRLNSYSLTITCEEEVFVITDAI